MDRRMWESMTRRDQEIYRVLAHAQSNFAEVPDELMNGGAGNAVRMNVYSHATAARLHSLHLWDVPALIHVTYRGQQSSGKLASDVRPHYRKLTAADVVVVRGMPVTSLERTVIDCACSLEFRKALVIADHALNLGANLTAMQAMVADLTGARGVRNARAVLDAADGRSESAGETLTRVLLRQIRVPMPELQVEVDTPAGRHRLDFGWRDRKVALEFDGDTKYFDYAPTSEVLLLERKRERALMEQEWRFVRLEWKDLFRPQYVEQRLRAVLLASEHPSRVR